MDRERREEGEGEESVDITDEGASFLSCLSGWERDLVL